LLIPIVALGVLLAGAAAGFVVATRLAPARVRVEVERALADQLGPVSIGSVRPYFGWGVGLEIADLSVLATAPGARLDADRVWVTVSARRLLRGELEARRVDARGVHVAAIETPDGALVPAVFERLRAREGRDDAPAPSLRSIASSLPAISIQDATLEVRRADGAALAARLFELALAHDPLGGPPALRASGRLERSPAPDPGGRDAGTFELDVVLDDPKPRGTLAMTELDLGALDPAWAAPLELRGRLSGVASWMPAEAGGALEVELLGSKLRARRNGDPDAKARLGRTRLRARVELGADRIAVQDLSWSADDQTVSAHGALEGAGTEAATLVGALDAQALDLAQIGAWLRVATAKGSTSREKVGALRAGDVSTLAISAERFPIGRLLEVLRTRAPATRELSREVVGWLDGVRIAANVRGVELRLGAGDPIRSLEGSFGIESHLLRIENARARIGDRPLPGLTLVVDGIPAMVEALREGALPPPVPSLPGRIALDRWIESKKRPGSPPRWRRIEVKADWIEHPALLRALEEVTATLAPASPGVHIRDAKGYWGGVPFTGTGSFYGGVNSRVEVRVAMSLPRRTGRRRADGEAWGRVRFRADLEKLGDFQGEWLQGVAQGVGDRVQLRRGEARLRPRGDMKGTVDLDLSHEDTVPYRARIELANGSLSDLMYDLKMDGAAARGTTDVDAELAGELRLDVPVLAAMRGSGDLRLRGGEINKRMNVLFSIAQVSDTLNPFRSRETIPYDEITAPLVLADGFARTEAFALEGPALRMVGTGQVDLVNEPHATEAVIGVFFFRTLDRVIGIFPLLNRMLLGPDDNLVSTYFAVSGPWADPKASLIPTKSIASGPASFVLEGLPAFVRGGLSTIERVLTRAPDTSGSATPPSQAAPAPGGPS
jgi:hypothetical protein